MSAAIKTRSNSKEKARTMVTKTSHSIRDRQNEDEFMAAAIGDSEWLKQSLKHSKTVNFDKNVSFYRERIRPALTSTICAALKGPTKTKRRCITPLN